MKEPDPAMPCDAKPAAGVGAGLLAAEDVLGDLDAWRRAGLKTALVTLVAIDGATPRPLGAQMAVAEDGRFTGYLSGGCLEKAVAEEAVAAIREGRNRLVRYGKGSKYFDLKLPCGSGLDLYFDTSIDQHVIEQSAQLRLARKPFQLCTDMRTGLSTIGEIGPAERPHSTMDHGVFHRVHVPQPHMFIVGAGPSFTAVARLLSAAGFSLSAASPDSDTRLELQAYGIGAQGFADVAHLDVGMLDRWTAAIVAFHEHDWEAPVLARLLPVPCFYIGALGSRAAQANRLERLKSMRFEAATLARIRGPIGAIPGAKSRLTLAAGVLAEIVSEAKAQGMLP